MQNVSDEEKCTVRANAHTHDTLFICGKISTGKLLDSLKTFLGLVHQLWQLISP